MHLLSGLSIPLILLLTLANADPSTDVTLGGKYIDYGCEASIRKTLGEAFDSLCPGPEKSCDQSRSYSRKVDWADSNNPVTERDITVKIEGALPNDDVRERVRNVLINAVNPTSAKPKDITWDTIGGGIGGCSMSRFTSYIGITHFDGEDLQYEIDVNIELDAPEDFCGQLETLEGIVGSIKGPVADYGGPIFGVITFFMCDIELAKVEP